MGNECEEVCASKGDFNFKLLLSLWLVPRVFVVKLVFYYHILLKIGFDPNAIYC